MDVNSDAFDAARSPQVVATPTLARRTTQGGPSNKRQNFCARQFSTRKSAKLFDLIYPNLQVDSVRTKATRMNPEIFVIFVRTPVFSRTIFVRTNAPSSRSSCAQTPSSCAQRFTQTSPARCAARANATSVPTLFVEPDQSRTIFGSLYSVACPRGLHTRVLSEHAYNSHRTNVDCLERKARFATGERKSTLTPIFYFPGAQVRKPTNSIMTLLSREFRISHVAKGNSKLKVPSRARLGTNVPATWRDSNEMHARHLARNGWVSAYQPDLQPQSRVGLPLSSVFNQP
jgi:hypothetical protein